MKKLSVFLLLLVGINSNLFPQFKKGDVELSLSGAFGSFKQDIEGRNFTLENNDSREYFMLSLRPGFFPVDGFEIEPEISWLSISDFEPGYNFSLDLAYNFQVEGSRAYPFVLFGAGIGNSVQMLGFTQRTSDKLDVFNINAGAGVKIMVNDFVAARIEYRYQRYSFTEENTFSDLEYTFTTHKLMFGFSIIL